MSIKNPLRKADFFIYFMQLNFLSTLLGLLFCVNKLIMGNKISPTTIAKTPEYSEFVNTNPNILSVNLNKPLSLYQEQY